MGLVEHAPHPLEPVRRCLLPPGIRLAQQKVCPVYFVHVSAGEGVRAVAEARAQGFPIYGETLHNYACFNAENYREDTA